MIIWTLLIYFNNIDVYFNIMLFTYCNLGIRMSSSINGRYWKDKLWRYEFVNVICGVDKNAKKQLYATSDGY